MNTCHLTNCLLWDNKKALNLNNDTGRTICCAIFLALKFNMEKSLGHGKVTAHLQGSSTIHKIGPILRDNEVIKLSESDLIDILSYHLDNA